MERYIGMHGHFYQAYSMKKMAFSANGVSRSTPEA
jgi:hypothetical protein